MASSNGDWSLGRKQAVFSQLDALNAADDEAHDAAYAASMRALTGYAEQYKKLAKVTPVRAQARDFVRRAAQNSSPAEARERVVNSSKNEVINVPARSAEDRVATLRRSVTTPARKTTDLDDEIVVIKDTPIASLQSVPASRIEDKSGPAPLPAALPRASTMSAISSITGKRKRGAPALQVPFEQQVFSGLVFMFVPNDETNPARRMRIQKAVQYGVKRATEWSSAVTHIVVESNLVAADVLKTLKTDILPTTARTVDESFISTCLAHKCIVDASQSRYQVRGVQEMLKASSPEKPASAPSDRSLQLKPAKDPGVMYDPRTPSKTDEESVRVLEVETSISSGSALPGVAAENATGSSSGYKDALQEAIDETKAMPALARMDSDEDDMTRPKSADGDDHQDSEAERPPSPDRPDSKQKKQGYTKRDDWQEKFQCMHPGADKTSNNPNNTTIAMLQELQTYYHETREHWRSLAYRKGIAALRKQSHRIITKEEAQAIPGIGESIAAKIEEIVWTNRLQRLENMKLEPTDHVLMAFIKIYGVGHTQASKWVQEGHRTLEDLLQRAKLTTNQRIGIAHYEDFQLRIPRAETEQLATIVRQALYKIDPEIQAMVGGSYRRGAADSGDIDFLITKPGAGSAYLRQAVVEQAIPWLTKVGFLTAALAVTSAADGSKWHGACQLPLHPKRLSLLRPNEPENNKNPWRRIDFLLVPWDELGGALIYFTGNDVFNRSMRLLARRKGMRLNQRGLYKDVMRRGVEKLSEGMKVSGSEEREIFEALGVPFRGPTERNA